MANKIMAMPKGPRFRATRRATACLVLSASIAIAGCDGPSVCHGGKLYTDSDGDGVYTKGASGWNEVDCVEPEGK